MKNDKSKKNTQKWHNDVNAGADVSEKQIGWIHLRIYVATK